MMKFNHLPNHVDLSFVILSTANSCRSSTKIFEVNEPCNLLVEIRQRLNHTMVKISAPSQSRLPHQLLFFVKLTIYSVVDLNSIQDNARAKRKANLKISFYWWIGLEIIWFCLFHLNGIWSFRRKRWVSVYISPSTQVEVGIMTCHSQTPKKNLKQSRRGFCNFHWIISFNVLFMKIIAHCQ
jgi:hypothetical protein